MFNIEAKPIFTRAVTVNVPDGESYREETFKATFNVLPTETIDGFDLQIAQGTTDFLRAVIVRLDDLADGNGKAVAYSEAVRDQVLQWPHVRLALAQTYSSEVTKASEGN